MGRWVNLGLGNERVQAMATGLLVLRVKRFGRLGFFDLSLAGK